MSKTILVTGASSGIGWDFAKALAEKGYTIYAAARRVERMSSLRAFGITPQSTHSAEGEYASLSKALDNAQQDAGKIASPPSVITRLVLKAVSSSKPKTRYAAGTYAKPLLFIRRWFSDRVFDRAIMSILG